MGLIFSFGYFSSLLFFFFSDIFSVFLPSFSSFFSQFSFLFFFADAVRALYQIEATCDCLIVGDSPDRELLRLVAATSIFLFFWWRNYFCF